MPPARTQAELEQQEQRSKLANSYQSLLNDFSSHDLKSVGNYTLGRLIGKGSFGKVYLASHKLIHGSKVVLKSAKKEDSNLAREIHHHRQFLHPHIARLYEVIVTESLVWLALEYCPGDELYNHLLENGRMEPAKVQKIFTQLVGAVTYVHSKSCVHRDLKLENILLDKNENVKLVDFGFTREYHGSTSYLQTWCGTVCYSAPEMLKGEKYAGEKVDVWSLGIILYALLCGELPFDEDDDAATKMRILKEEPVLPDHIPEPAQELIKKLLSRRPLLRPCLADILRDPWLAEHAPHQNEILKLQQPAAFSTQIEKDTLERMRSAGVDIDMVIENVLSQRCDPLAGWWALLIEKEQRKEKRRERKRRERELETKSIRRLSAASGRLLLAQSALLEIHEGEEVDLHKSPSRRGRRMSRNSLVAQAPTLPQVIESKTSPSRDFEPPGRVGSRSRSRPAPPPKDVVYRRRNPSRGSGSMLRYSTLNPDLLAPLMPPPPQRKRAKFYPQPLKEQLAWFKHLFRDSAKRAKSPNTASTLSGEMESSAGRGNGSVVGSASKLRRVSTGPTPARPTQVNLDRPALQTRATMPVRPRLDTASSTGSVTSVRAKRTSRSPGTLTPHSSYRHPSIGLRGRKSTSSSVSSIRTAYHQHTHSKASSTSSASIASPSGLSSASGSRLPRSPHASVKVLPSTPTSTTFPSGIRISRRPLPSASGASPSANDVRPTSFTNLIPGSPSLPVFARRKRSIFKGPMSGSPAGFGRNSLSTIPSGSSIRAVNIPGRRSGEMIPVTEEDEEEMEEIEDEDELDDAEDEDHDEALTRGNDHFGPELSITPLDTDDAISPFSPLDRADLDPMMDTVTTSSHLTSAISSGDAAASPHDGGTNSSGVPLTAAALAQMEEQELQRRCEPLGQDRLSSETPATYLGIGVQQH